MGQIQIAQFSSFYILLKDDKATDVFICLVDKDVLMIRGDLEVPS